MSSDSVRAAEAAAGRRLRLFTGPAPGAEAGQEGLDELSPEMRLGEFFRGYVLPVVGASCNWSPGTIASYREAIDYWSELTRDLPLRAIDQYETAAFVAGLRQQTGRADELLSTASVRKHCATVQRILQIAGPQKRSAKKDLRRFGAELIASVPWIEAPDPDDKPPSGDFTLEEVLQQLAAARRMTWPRLRGVAAPAWWRALIYFMCGTGLRIGTVMLLEWVHISDQRLLIPGAIAKRKKKHRLWLHPEVAAAIEPLRGLAPRVFASQKWPRPGAKRYLYAKMDQLLSFTAIPPERHFKFHGYRRFVGTQIFRVAGVEAAANVLNHASSDTTLRSYVNAAAQDEAQERLQRAAIERLPLFAHES